MKKKLIFVVLVLLLLLNQTDAKKLQRKRKFVFTAGLVYSIVTGSYYALYEVVNYNKAQANQNAITVYSQQLNTVDSIERIFLSDTLKLCSKATASVALNSQVLFALNLKVASHSLSSHHIPTHSLHSVQEEFSVLNHQLKTVFPALIHTSIDRLTDPATFISELLDTDALVKAQRIAENQIQIDNATKDKICFSDHSSLFDNARSQIRDNILEAATELEYTNSIIRLFFGSFTKTREQVSSLLDEELNKLYKEKQISNLYRYMKGVARLGIAVVNTFNFSAPVVSGIDEAFYFTDLVRQNDSFTQIFKSSIKSASGALTLVSALKSIFKIAKYVYSLLTQGFAKKNEVSTLNGILNSVFLVSEIYNSYNIHKGMDNASNSAMVELSKLKNTVLIQKSALNLRVINLSYNALGRFRKYGGIGKLVVNSEILLKGAQLRSICEGNILMCYRILGLDYSGQNIRCAKDIFVGNHGLSSEHGFVLFYKGKKLSVYLNYDFSTNTKFVLDFTIGIKKNKAKARFEQKIKPLRPKIQYKMTKLTGIIDEIFIFWSESPINKPNLRRICHSYSKPQLVSPADLPPNTHIEPHSDQKIKIKAPGPLLLKIETNLAKTLSEFVKRPILAFTPEELTQMRVKAEEIKQKILKQAQNGKILVSTNILTDLTEIKHRLYTGIDLLLIGQNIALRNITVPVNSASELKNLYRTLKTPLAVDNISGDFKTSFELVKLDEISPRHLFVPHNSGEGQCLHLVFDRVSSQNRFKSQNWSDIINFDKMKNSGNLESLQHLDLLGEYFDVLKFNSKEEANVPSFDKLKYLTETENEFNMGGALSSRHFKYISDKLIAKRNKYCGYFTGFREIRIEGPISQYGMEIVRNNEQGFPVLKLSRPEYGELAYHSTIFVGMFYESNSLSDKKKVEFEKVKSGLFRKLSHFNHYALPNNHLEVKVKNEGIVSTYETIKAAFSDQDGKVTLYVFVRPVDRH